MNPVEFPIWVWTFFFAVVFIALFDIGIVNRSSHVPSRKETIAWSIVWVSLALLFNGFVYWYVNANHGAATAFFKAKEFLTGYIIELSLSVDNLFVFLLIFNYFQVPKKYQHRVLFWGIFMALVLRMVMIFACAELVEQFHWILYIFGAFLVYTGINMLREDDEFHPDENFVVRLTTRFIRISKQYDGEDQVDDVDHHEDEKKQGPDPSSRIVPDNEIVAIFGITTDRFIVYTSNIFAILGLRTFFFLLLGMAEKFHYLKYGLAFVLSFIGVKMLLPLLAEGLIMILGSSTTGFAEFVRRYQHHEFEQAVINISLGVVVLAILCSIALSLIFPNADEEVSET
ncbi:MAG TPA: hypothetical protein PKM58_02920, partial [Pyrinomonadaceae bacterium]|nr:hypothetical protein [Pyrinomonadaceae bacterium]